METINYWSGKLTTDAQRQFARQASFYAVSAPHASGESLWILRDMARAKGHECALDIATGTGFTALALAPLVRWVLATDIALPMLFQTQQLARQRDISNLYISLAAAEDLPFDDNVWDIVSCRTAAHHFKDVKKAVSEMARVAKDGGSVLICDTISPEDGLTSAWMHDVESRRDTSHQRNLKVSEWRQIFEDYGLYISNIALVKTELEFFDWVKRSGAPPEETAALERDFRNAPASMVSEFDIEVQDSCINFAWDAVVLRADKT